MDIYSSEEIAENFYIIVERIGKEFLDTMWLVIGKSKAALIDTGFGADNIKAYISTITNLPVVVLNTHADPDHIGGNPLFNECYLSKRDVPIIPWASSKAKRLSDIKFLTGNDLDLYKYIEEHLVDSVPFNRKDIEEDDIIDLGGTKLEAIALPGHSKGSMGYIDKKNLRVFTGDTILPDPWLFMERCLSMETYLRTLEHFKDRTKDIEYIYCGHSVESLDRNVLEGLIAGAEEILNGAEGETSKGMLGYDDHRVHKHGQVAIHFCKNNLFDKKN